MATGTESKSVPYDEHEENGRFKRKYTDEMVMDAIEQHGGAASTGEVSDVLGCTGRLALKRLRGLEESGRVSAREVGNTYLWSKNDG